MLNTEAIGEIVEVGHVLDPEKAQVLGDTVLSLFDEFIAQPEIRYDERGSMLILPSDLEVSKLNIGRYPANGILIGKDDRVIVDTAISCFDEVLGKRKNASGLDIDAEFFIGTAGDGDWHFDGVQQYRMLVNLSRQPLSLLVAAEWDQTSYGDYLDFLGRSKFRKQGPAVSETITYNTGEGVLLDNMCQPKLQVPHAGVKSPNKVFMRVYTNPITS